MREQGARGPGTPAYLVVDAGTSRTRVRWWQGGVLDEAEAPVGAKDVAREGTSAPLAAALREAISTVRARHAVAPDAVVCSGMITSNVGLLEVPHVAAPVSLARLARHVVRHDLPGVTDLPLYFVAGIKTVAAGGAWDALDGFDLMRGEEAEVAGLLASGDPRPPVAFFHTGSHHKLIEVGVVEGGPNAGGVGDAGAADDAEGLGPAVVLRSATALTGELLAALRERTILASSLTDLDGLAPDPEAVAAGVRHVRRAGFARAAFLVRAAQTIGGRDRAEATSFLLGALAALDLQLIERELPPGRELVLYGGGAFPALLAELLARDGRHPHRVVPRSESEAAATVGAVRLLRARLVAGRS